MIKFLSLIILLFTLNCNKKNTSFIEDCATMGEVYSISLKESNLLLYSWKELKNRHRAILIGMGTELDENKKEKLTQNFFLSLRTHAALSCGIEPLENKMIQKTSKQEGQLIQIQHLPSVYYKCLLSLWEKKAQELFVNGCRKSQKI